MEAAIETADNKKPAEEVVTNDANEQENVPQHEFSYLERKEFTSEIFKVEIRNLGYFGFGEFKKLLKAKLKLDATKIKAPTRRDFAFVCFRSLQDQERAIKILNGYKWKGKSLKAIVAKASADPLMKRRKAQEHENSNEAKKQRTSVEATCPLASMPYKDQLINKTAEIQDILNQFTKELQRINSASKSYLETFDYEGVEPSPLVNGYRNKNEFTVGKNATGDIVVGFRLGSYADGSLEVSDVEALPHLPDAAKWAAKTFQEFVRQSKFKPFNPEINAGHYRQLMVRTSAATSEVMLVAGIFGSNLKRDDLAELKAELKNFYEKYESNDFKCTSLYYQDVQHRKAGQLYSPVDHLWGTTHITDTICGLNFRISPLAFFQINTQSANILYEKIIELAEPKAHSTVLDICCGTGTIALAFAKHCKQVQGVDIVADAIKDADFNAAANNIKNCKFRAGNADDYIQSMVREVIYDNAPGTPMDLIAVVDPPRAGLHNRSIAAIRAAKAINRLVYVSCNPARAQRNWIELGRAQSKHYKGQPFFPKTAVAVDMFPHTSHTELIILFERIPSTETPPKILLVEVVGSPESVKPKVDAVEAPKTVEPKIESVEAPPAVQPKVEIIEGPQLVKPKVETVEAPPLVKPKVETVEVSDAVRPTIETVKAPQSVKPTVETVEASNSVKPKIETVKAPPTVVPIIEIVKAPQSVEPTVETVEAPKSAKPKSVKPTIEAIGEAQLVMPIVETVDPPNLVKPTVETVETVESVKTIDEVQSVTPTIETVTVEQPVIASVEPDS